jgi:hypothetical protein
LIHHRSSLLLATLLISTAFATAANLKGTVVIGTTGRPGAGDEIVLLSLSQEGMNETARGIVDSQGRFTLTVADPEAAHIVRVTHQGVTYHKLVQAGSAPLLIKVYDVAQQLEGIQAVMDVQRFEATADQLEVKQLITVRNDSKPPRTLVNDRSFEIQLPPEARVQSGLVQVEGGRPLKQKPVSGDQRGQYYFEFPIRPGDTRFAVVYRLPYNGEALIEPQIRNPLEKFVVMLPKSMKFQPKTSGVFEAMPGTTPDNVLGTGPLRPDQVVAFRVSGTGTLQELEGRRQEVQTGKTDSAARPGGGLGPPIEAPDPLQKYRLPILAGIIVLMSTGAGYVARKTRLPHAESLEWVGPQVPSEAIKKETSRRRGRRRHRQGTHV